jgi:hypothetical protein
LFVVSFVRIAHSPIHLPTYIPTYVRTYLPNARKAYGECDGKCDGECDSVVGEARRRVGAWAGRATVSGGVQRRAEWGTASE